MTDRISQHISYHEATFSATAKRLNIDNTPDAVALENMRVVAENCFEPARQWMGQPIRVNSFYRSKELNAAVKGSPTSQHCKGEAIDMNAGSRAENKRLFEWCKANLVFDQLIWEYGDETGPDWVHISFRKGANRNQTLKIG